MLIDLKRTILNSTSTLSKDFQLTGRPRNALFQLPEDLVAYFFSVLREESIEFPDVSIEQWERLLQYLKAHFIWPLLYYKLSKVPKENRPPEVIMQKLQLAYLQSMSQNVQAEIQLKEILDAFRREGIRSLVLKGPSLGFSVYPKPGARPFSDLDLLVRPSQFEDAKRVLGYLGYSSKLNMFELREGLYWEEAFVSSDSRKPFATDIHWRVYQFSNADFDETLEGLFARSLTVSTPSVSFEALNRLDNLVFLSLHLLHHCCDVRLLWLYDIHLLLNALKTRDEWLALRKRCDLWDATLVFTEAVLLVSLFFDSVLPQDYHKYFSDIELNKSEILNSGGGLRQYEVTTRFRNYVPKTSSVFDKLIRSLKLLFPPPHYVRTGYPPAHPSLLPLSYVKRWYYWLQRAVK